MVAGQRRVLDRYLLLIVRIFRVTPLDKIDVGKDKLEQKTIDFEKLEESGLKEGKWDVVYIACVAVLIHFLQPAQTRVCAGSGRAKQPRRALPLLRRSTESPFISLAMRFTRT